MCISITIAPVSSRRGARGNSGTLEPEEVRRRTGLFAEERRGGELSLSPPDDCGCSIARRGEVTGKDWHLAPEHLPAFDALVEVGLRRLKRFRLTFSWIDDPVHQETAVTADQMLRHFRHEPLGLRSFVVRRS